MNVSWLTASNGTSTMDTSNGKKRYWTTLRLNSSATARLCTMTWFTRSTGWRNGAAQGHSAWALNCHSTNSTWSSPFQTPPSTSLTTLSLTCSKVTWMALRSVFWESDMRILPTTFGTMFCWARTTPPRESLSIKSIRSESPSCTGIQWTWDAQPRIS